MTQSNFFMPLKCCCGTEQWLTGQLRLSVPAVVDGRGQLDETAVVKSRGSYVKSRGSQLVTSLHEQQPSFASPKTACPLEMWRVGGFLAVAASGLTMSRLQQK